MPEQPLLCHCGKGDAMLTTAIDMRRGARTHVTPRPQHLRVRWSLLLLLLLLPLLVWAEDPGKALETQYGLYPDFAANLRVQYIGQRMARAVGVEHAAFAVIDQRELNAMALPDGRIYITSLMATTISDDELAFVLGHELTHVKAQHARDQYQRTTLGTLAGAALAALLGGSERDIRLGADIIGGLTYGHYSRKDEHHADAGGVEGMVRAGYDPQRAADAIQRLIDRYGRGDARVPVLGWFASHPDSKNRKERLSQSAKKLQETPPEPLPASLGVALVLDDTSAHAREWMHDYLATRIVMSSQGVAAIRPPAIASSILAAAGDAPWTAEMPKNKKDPLPKVAVLMPDVPTAYRARVAVRQIPAYGAKTTTETRGTAVEATLEWTDLRRGFSGVVRATAQTRNRVAWQAHEQLEDAAELHKLSDGKRRNLEGTLEATAVRRVAMAFAEVVREDGPVDHSAPVTLRIAPRDVRVGDYVYVKRGARIISEVQVTAINGRTVSGQVLWGGHSWQVDDTFERAT